MKGIRFGPRDLVLAALVVAVLVLSVLLYATHRRLLEVEWDSAVAWDEQLSSEVSLQVGAIQFLDRGYTLMFDVVEYRNGGLFLSGTIGNPTLLTISSLTLYLELDRYPYHYRSEFEEEYSVWPSPIRNAFFSGNDGLGQAQAFVGVVPPGATARFTATIPNVTESDSPERLKVLFSGERYSYSR